MTEINGRIFSGVVVKAAMNGAVVVDIESKKTHRLYAKSYTANRRIKAKSDGTVNVGDRVNITEVRPQSRDIHYKVTEVLK